MRIKRGGVPYILPSFLGLSLFFLVPFVISLRYVFSKGIADMRFVGLENFSELLRNPAFQLAVRNTALFMAVAVPALTLGAMLLAMLLADGGHKLVRGALLAPMIVPVASALLGWSAVFGVNGILNALRGLFGGTPREYFSNPYARWVLIFLFLIKNLGYMTIILGGAIAAIPKEYREAFSLDSSSTVKYTVRVVTPIISPVIFFVIILSVVNCFQVFREVYGLYGDHPPNSLYMLQNFMNNNFLKLNYNRLCAASFLVSMTIAAFIFLYLYVRRKREREVGE